MPQFFIETQPSTPLRQARLRLVCDTPITYTRWIFLPRSPATSDKESAVVAACQQEPQFLAMIKEAAEGQHLIFLDDVPFDPVAFLERHPNLG